MQNDAFNLFDTDGNRLYLTRSERDAFLEAAKVAERPVRTLCTVLHFTGCRISEALELNPTRIDFANQAIVFRSLKKRGKVHHRAIPVPSEVLDQLDMVHGIREALKANKKNLIDKPLWAWSRTTAWRKVKTVMELAGFNDSPQFCPKGLRHGYGVHAICSGVPLNILQKFMGHSKLETTTIYANALGEEQRNIAAKMWD